MGKKRNKKKANDANALKTGMDVLRFVWRNMWKNPTVSVRPGGKHQLIVQGKTTDGEHIAFPVSDHPQETPKGTLKSTIKKLIKLGLLTGVGIVTLWQILPETLKSDILSMLM